MANKNTTEAAAKAAEKIVEAIRKSPEVLRPIEDAIKEVEVEAKTKAKEIEETLLSVGTSKEEIVELSSHLDEYRQIEFLNEVYIAIKHYKEVAQDKSKTIEEALEYFRFKVAKFGFSPFWKEDRDLIPLVSAYGTIKDRVALVVNCYFEHVRTFPQEERILSDEQAKEIRNRVGIKGTKTEKDEFTNYLEIYDTLNKAKTLYYRIKHKYFSCALTATSYFQTYEWLTKAEEFFNYVSPLIDPNKKEEFERLTEEYNNYLKNYQRFGELKAKSGKGWVDKQRKDCLSWAISTTDVIVKQSLSEYKGSVVAFQKWIKDNDAEMLLPDGLRKELFFAKENSYLSELQDKYYSSHINKMIKRGETPTKEDKKIAVFPEWENVKPDKDTQKYIISQIDGIREQFKQ